MLGLGELLHSQLILLGLLWDGPVPPPRTLFSDLGRTLRSRGAWLMPSVIPTCPPIAFFCSGDSEALLFQFSGRVKCLRGHPHWLNSVEAALITSRSFGLVSPTLTTGLSVSRAAFQTYPNHSYEKNILLCLQWSPSTYLYSEPHCRARIMLQLHGKQNSGEDNLLLIA